MLEERILVSIKKLLGLTENDDSFDEDIIIHINSAFMVLHQLGVGSTAFSITGDAETWSDFISDRADLAGVKTYVFMKVKLMFDPPGSSIVAEAMKQTINEFEWRINVTVDPDVIDAE